MKNIAANLKALLDLFERHVPDHESNRLAWDYCNDRDRWGKAEGLFSEVRGRHRVANRNGEAAKQRQHNLEEHIAKTLVNLTHPDAPFDADSPYWIAQSAFLLAAALDVPADRVVEVLTRDAPKLPPAT